MLCYRGGRETSCKLRRLVHFSFVLLLGVHVQVVQLQQLKMAQEHGLDGLALQSDSQLFGCRVWAVECTRTAETPQYAAIKTP